MTIPMAAVPPCWRERKSWRPSTNQEARSRISRAEGKRRAVLPPVAPQRKRTLRHCLAGQRRRGGYQRHIDKQSLVGGYGAIHGALAAEAQIGRDCQLP